MRIGCPTDTAVVRTDRIKCGQLYVFTDQTFLLICDFCAEEYHNLDAIKSHLYDHFPKLITSHHLNDAMKQTSTSATEGSIRTKCGQIFIFPDHSFSLVCDFCRDDYDTLDALGLHLYDHFPKPLPSVMLDLVDPIGSDNETMPSDACVYMDPENNEKGVRQVSAAFSHTTAVESQLLNEIVATKLNKVCNRRKKRNAGNYKPIIGNRLGRAIDVVAKKPKKTYECSFCGKVFRHEAKRNDHENTHSGKRPHQCHVCSNAFASATSLARHIKQHTGERRLCSVCGKRFSNTTKLETHIRERHLPDTDPRRYFACRLCDGKFKTSHQLSDHGMTHRNTTFTCDHCQRQFTSRKYILQHMQVVHSKRTHKCGFCSKIFHDNVTLGDHENIHTGRRPHQCHFCSAAFFNYRTLRRHVKVHTDVVEALPMPLSIDGQED